MPSCTQPRPGWRPKRPLGTISASSSPSTPSLLTLVTVRFLSKYVSPVLVFHIQLNSNRDGCPYPSCRQCSSPQRVAWPPHWCELYWKIKIAISILCEIENVDREREKEIPEPAWPSEMSMVMARTTGYCILAVVVIFKETGSGKKSGRWV